MTEIAPGMMVECIKSTTPNSISIGRKAFVLKAFATPMCQNKHGPCGSLILLNWPTPNPSTGWAQCCFKPIGGDKEIEKEKFAELKPDKIPAGYRLARG